jgi:hypothetical protein
MEQATFKWGNYLRATPANLQFLALGLKSILVTVAGATFFSGNEKAGFYILLFGAVLDELSKFFGHVNEEAMKSVTVTYPEKIADQVKVTEKTEVKPKDE